MKDKLFNLLKSLYKKIPVSYKTKNRLKGGFYRMFGFFFKNTTSYRVWTAVNMHTKRNDFVKPDKNKICNYNCNYKIAVQLHLYYIDLLEEFIKYFSYIPYKFDIMVSIVDKNKLDFVKGKLSCLNNVDNIYVDVIKNRGRDVAPLLSAFGKKIMEYDYICHVHSKKSLFTGGEQTEWRQHLLNGLMGSGDIVKSNLYMLENGDKAGIIYPETFCKMPYYGHTWLKNREAGEELLTRIGVTVKNEDIYIDYPMGTMFWAKVNAIRQFFEADIKISEFPKEAGQTDGTVAHAFERCLGVVCRYNGYNMLIFDDKDCTYAYNYGMKNMNQYFLKSYEHMKKELEMYDIVSFDIFDTLISRKISGTSSISKLVELKADKYYNIKSNFAKMRLTAEKSAVNKHPDKDVSIDDIYEELKKISGWGVEKINKVKEIELYTEYSLIAPKKEIICILKYVRHQLKKKVYLISDMHLRKNHIKTMLKSCGINEEDYDEILLSSDMNKRKDNGTMWQYFVSLFKGKKYIHIGDNEVSDVQTAGDYGIVNYHVMSCKALFQLSSLGKSIGVIDDKGASNAVEIGLVLNKLFSDPFKYNKTRFEVKIDDAKTFGYGFIGPVVLNYVLWLLKEAENIGAKRILFFSREGYIFKKVFDIILMYCQNSKIKGDYIYVSRRALMSAAIKEENDINRPLDIYYEGKLDNLLRKRFGINIENVPDEDIKLPDNKGKVIKYINAYKKEILMQAKCDRENYLKYLERILFGISPDDRVVVSDIGYSGTIQYYLSLISERGFDGRYMATDNKKKPAVLNQNTIMGYYIDGDCEQEISESYIHRYHLMFESVFISPDGQLVRMDKAGQPVFEEKENRLYDYNITAIHEGILEYAKEYACVMGTSALDEIPEKNFAERLTYAVLNTDILEKSVADSMLVDDKYCSGEVRNVVDFYRRRN